MTKRPPITDLRVAVPFDSSGLLVGSPLIHIFTV
ncbi:hypothetical protein BH18VER2_BH18VER2_03880 [soil metagenome]